MSIQLTTPFSPGDIDPGKDYTHVRIMQFGIQLLLPPDLPVIGVHVARGYLDEGGEFVPGKLAPMAHEYRDRPRAETTEFTALVMGSISSAAGQTAYQIAAMGLYTALLTEYPGTIV